MLGLADVPASTAASLGVPGFQDSLGLGDAQHAIIILIDGMGWNSLHAHAHLAPCLTSGHHQAREISTVFPSTTPAGLGTVGTALLPGAHGLVGASFWLPEAEEVLTPLHWNDGVTPVAVQPEATVFERAERAGVHVTTIAPGAYRDSGLTRAALRGGDYLAAESLAERVELSRSAAPGWARALTYVYWAGLDRTGHAEGVGSVPWQRELEQVDHLVARLTESLPTGTVAVVTADHGMVNCDERISIEGDPILSAGVARIAGEPRMRHVYAQPGAESDVAAAWSERLAGRVDIRTRDEVAESGLLGDVEPDYLERLGDILAISRGTAALTSAFDTRVSSLIGQHGALTDDEMRIPAIVIRGDS